MVRIGIVGMGGMGRVHFQQYLKMKDVRVVAVADIDPTRIAGQSAGGWDNIGKGGDKTVDLSGLRGTLDHRELIKWPEVDIVDICTPTDVHVPIAIDALQAGKHVTMEKPTATRSAEAQKVADVVKRTGKFFMPAMVMRFWPDWVWLKEAVVSGRYGNVRHAIFRRVGSCPGGWFANPQRSGGALFDLHIHDVDFIYHLFGRPQAVFSRGYGSNAGYTDHVVTQYMYEDVPLVSAEGGWELVAGWGFSMRCTINFEKATADFDLGRGDSLLLTENGKTTPVPLEKEFDGYYRELEYFVNCVRNKEKPTKVTIQDAVESLKIIEAEQKSVISGQAVSL